MKQIWAPWRMQYIEAEKGRQTPSSCIFCDKPSAQEGAENLILYKGKATFVMMNAFPYTNGHLLVSPYQHSKTLEDLPQKTLTELMGSINLCLAALRSVFSPDGINIGINLGRVAGAGVEDHVHCHLVPRWNGDTNFMPIFADVRVIPEDLKSTYGRLLPFFQKSARHRRKTT